MNNKKDIKHITNNSKLNHNEILKQFEINAKSVLTMKYAAKIISNKFIAIITNSLIFNKNSHLVAEFKDSMIWDYVDEFLKRYYKKQESIDRVPRFATFYKNYLKFFCKPIFINFSANSVLQDYNEKKAELYYNQNFQSRNEDVDEGNDAMDEDGDDDDESKKSISKSKVEKTIFNSTVKNTIENESIVTVVNNNEITITLPDNEFNIFNQSGLLNEYSNEQSLIMLMNCINKKKEKNIHKHKGIPIISGNNNNNKNKAMLNTNKHFKPYSRNSNHNLDTKESKFICYTNLCQKKNFQVIKEQNLRDHTKSQTQLKQSFNNKKSRNVTNVNNSTSKFKTFELFTTSNNNNNVNNNTTANKNRLIKTQNVENIINRITQQVNQNTKAHKRNNYSTDNFISNHSKYSHNTKTFQTHLLRSTNIKKNTTLKDKKVITHNNENAINNNNKRKTSSKKPMNTNSTQVLSSNNNNNTNADDIMKKTFTFLISNNPHKINNNKLNNNNNNAIHIQSVNININNQININNNNANANNIQENIPSKLNTGSLNKYKKPSQQPNKQDKPITGIQINRKSRNKGGSYDINHNTGTAGNSNGMIFSSCNGLDSQGLNSFMKKSAAKTTFYNSNAISSQIQSKNGNWNNSTKGLAGEMKDKLMKNSYNILKTDNIIKVSQHGIKKGKRTCTTNKLKNLQYKISTVGNNVNSNNNITKNVFTGNTNKTKTNITKNIYKK